MSGHTLCSDRVFRHSSVNELTALHKDSGQPALLWGGEPLHAPLLTYCKTFLSLLYVFQAFIQIFSRLQQFFCICTYSAFVHLSSFQSLLECVPLRSRHCSFPFQRLNVIFSLLQLYTSLSGGDNRTSGNGFQMYKKIDKVPLKVGQLSSDVWKKILSSLLFSFSLSLFLLLPLP